MITKTKILAPYGTWKSPLTVDAITNTDNAPDLVDVLVDPITSAVFHIEKRPAEGGRNALLRTESRRDVTGGEWNVKNSVNGYGSAPAIVYDSVAYFSNAEDGRVYKVNVESSNDVSEAITPENTSHKFANFDVHPIIPTLLICVMEDHADKSSPTAVVNSLGVIDVSTKTVFPLESDASFYSYPKFSADGKRLLWIEWDLPDMPWNSAEIWVADVVTASGSPPLLLQNQRHVAGEHGKISVSYPSWLSDGTLLFLSDVSGFPNPWIYACSTGEAKPVLEIPIPESFGYGNPPGWLGWSPYAVANAQGTAAVFTAIKMGTSVLYLVDFGIGTVELLPSPYVEIRHIRALRPSQNQFAFIGTKADARPAIVQCTLSTTVSPTKPTFINLQSDSHGLTLPPEYISLPMPLSLSVPDETRTHPVHVVYYAPTNPEYAGIAGEKPPLVLHVHGGPVNFASQSFNATKQFFTSRGWAWLDVNYGGSSGHGRAYMERLRESWGVVDVDDCIDAARILSSPPHNLMDRKRIVIRGPSAGGFTVLSALSINAHTDIFAAGTSLYGVSDLRRLEAETHKFESGYLRMLIGADPQLLVERSPIFQVEKITAPLLILQGDSDTAVPKSQAEVCGDRLPAKSESS
ncbi:Alpha/Beta hydrolase protein [Mycena crocata]|nr:Alpha/Beta hydrolase protein [Mycena crocata]